MTLACPNDEWKMLTFPGASDLYWRFFLTQVSPEDFASGKTIENLHHKPLAFLSKIL